MGDSSMAREHALPNGHGRVNALPQSPSPMLNELKISSCCYVSASGCPTCASRQTASSSLSSLSLASSSGSSNGAGANGRTTGVEPGAGFYHAGRSASGSSGGRYGAASSLSVAGSMNTSIWVYDDDVPDNVRTVHAAFESSGGTPLDINRSIVRKFPDLSVRKVSDYVMEDSNVTVGKAIDEIRTKEWAQPYNLFKTAVESLPDHVKIFDRSETGPENVSLDELRNRVFGFVCTAIEPLSANDAERKFGDVKPQFEEKHKRYYLFHGIIVRKRQDGTVVEGNDDEVMNGGAAAGSGKSAIEPKPAAQAIMPDRTEIDALSNYFIHLQDWAQLAADYKYGKLNQQRATRGRMVLFKPELSLKSSWLRGIIDAVEVFNGRACMTVRSIDTGHTFKRVPFQQATWIIPEWLEKLAPLSVRAVFYDTIKDLYARKVVTGNGYDFVTRMFLNVADENVMDPSLKSEPMFQKQLAEQMPIWYCLLRRQQCLRSTTLHLRYWGATFHAPTRSMAEENDELIAKIWVAPVNSHVKESEDDEKRVASPEWE